MERLIGRSFWPFVCDDEDYAVLETRHRQLFAYRMARIRSGGGIKAMHVESTWGLLWKASLLLP